MKRRSRKPRRPSAGRPPRRAPRRRRTDRAVLGDTWVASALEGIEDVARAEIVRRFGRHVDLHEHPRSNEIHFTYRRDDPERLLSLKTVQTLLLRRDYAVDRPRTLLSPEHIASVADLAKRTRELPGVGSPSAFRIDAAGADSPTMSRIAEHLERALRLPFDADKGDCVITIRPGESGWEILCRVGNRPLATRSWRKRNYRGSLNATIAAAMVELTRPKPADRYLNLMCGGGTLLIERALRQQSVAAVGIDSVPRAIAASETNVAAAGVGDRVHLVEGDAAQTDFPDASFDVITADLPYGESMGDRASNADLYARVLAESARLLRRRGTAVFLTQDLAAMSEALASVESRFRVTNERRIVQRDFRPLCIRLVRK